MRTGSEYEVDRTDDIIQHLRAMEIDALICIGGDGTLTIAHALHQRGLAQGSACDWRTQNHRQ